MRWIDRQKERMKESDCTISRTRDRKSWLARSETQKSPCFLSFSSRGSRFIRTDGQPSIGSSSNARIFIRFLATNTVFRAEGTLRRWHRSHESSTIPFRPARIVKIRGVASKQLYSRYIPSRQAPLFTRGRRSSFLSDSLAIMQRSGV